MGPKSDSLCSSESQGSECARVPSVRSPSRHIKSAFLGKAKATFCGVCRWETEKGIVLISMWFQQLQQNTFYYNIIYYTSVYLVRFIVCILNRIVFAKEAVYLNANAFLRNIFHDASVTLLFWKPLCKTVYYVFLKTQ